MTKVPMKYIITFLICIIFSCQIGKSKTHMPQSKYVESTIKICVKENLCFSIQLLNFFSEEGNYKLLCVKRNGRHIANVKLPSSEDVKNLKAHIRKYRNDCILECLYGVVIICTAVIFISDAKNIICIYIKSSLSTQSQMRKRMQQKIKIFALGSTFAILTF